MTRDPVPQPSLAPEVEQRRCGRCRRLFDGDPTLDVHGRSDWWLCPPCEAAVLPSRARRLALVTPLADETGEAGREA